MTSEADISASLPIHSKNFEQATREQWTELAIAGLRSDDANLEALQSLRQTTLDAIRIDVLYDASKHDYNVPCKPETHAAIDNRVAIKEQSPASVNSSMLQALSAGATSVELTLQDEHNLASCLSGVQLDLAPVCLRAGHRFAQCSQAFMEHAASTGVAPDAINSVLATDPIGLLLTGKISEKDLASQLGDIGQHAQSVLSHLPNSRSVLIDVAIHHNAGASVVEELHAALTTALVYLEYMLDSGLSTEQTSEQIVFQLAMDSDVLLGVAKLRAVQHLWQGLLKAIDAAYQPEKPAQIIVETSQRQLSLMQPWNNHLRNLAASTAAMLGSADTLLVHPHNQIQATQTQEDIDLGQRMARNIAIILERECGLNKVHDPMAGSYAMENLTRQLVDQTWQSLAQTDTSEGWLDELNSGRWQARLSQTHERRIASLDAEKTVSVGVNRYMLSGEKLTASDASTTVLPPALQRVRESAVFEQRTATGAKA